MMMENTASASDAAKNGINVSNIKDKVEQVKTRMVEKTQDKLQATSKTVDDVMLYLKDHDTQAMVDDLQVVIRKHPGKSLLAGLAIGLLAGRLLSPR